MSGARAGVTTSPAVPDTRQSVRTANTAPAVAGPPGSRQRLTGATEVFHPGLTGVRRKFEVDVVGLCPGGSIRVTDIDVRAREVDHASGAPSLPCGWTSMALSSLTPVTLRWTEAIPRAADLLAAEAYLSAHLE